MTQTQGEHGDSRVTAIDSGILLRPDQSRVIVKSFIPTLHLNAEGKTRFNAIIQRILGLNECRVRELLEETKELYRRRHRNIDGIFSRHYELVANRIPAASKLSISRQLLIGAYLTSEYSVEAGALFNPSMVAHPDQVGLPVGATRFVMSVRAVGEGHISSVEFRTGTINSTNTIFFDSRGDITALSSRIGSQFERHTFSRYLNNTKLNSTLIALVVSVLPETFNETELANVLNILKKAITREELIEIEDSFCSVTSSNFTTVFPEGSFTSERVIYPESVTASHGIEDVRLVRFVEQDGTVMYRGTYTAYDGHNISPEFISTPDFRSFTFYQADHDGTAGVDKGMALFGRKINGTYWALSRWDKESNILASSTDLVRWDHVSVIQTPHFDWGFVQVGNCGSPIETEAGWLVLTHGVGPMREYSIGALLLDLDDPRKVIGELTYPLLRPLPGDRDGYVPGVVYSCGGMLHNNTLILPYGVNDKTIRIAYFDINKLLNALMAP